MGFVEIYTVVLYTAVFVVIALIEPSVAGFIGLALWIPIIGRVLSLW